MKLHFGVIDFPYSHAGGTTTGQVAQWLENKYGIMLAFWIMNNKFCVEELNDALAGALDNILMGQPVSIAPFGKGTSAIENRFDQFITLQEVEHLGIRGVPTQAALDGVRTGMKSSKGKGPRPSFFDTGLYRSSFIVWVDEL